MSTIMDSTSSQENDPITPTNRSRSNTRSTSPFNIDTIRHQNHPYEHYRAFGSGRQMNEERDEANVIFVSGIVSSIEIGALVKVFGQFGKITLLGRHWVGFETGLERKPNESELYIFVTYASVEGAQRALQAGEVIVAGRKLTIKPPSFFPREDDVYGGYIGGDESVLRALRGISPPDYREEHAFEQQHPEQNEGQNNTSTTAAGQVGSYDPRYTPSNLEPSQ